MRVRESERVHLQQRLPTFGVYRNPRSNILLSNKEWKSNVSEEESYACEIRANRFMIQRLEK